MNVRVEDRSGIRVVRIDGMLTHEGESQLVSTVVNLLNEGSTRIVLDLGDVQMINSAGLGALVRVTAQVNSQHGRIALARPSPFVTGVLENTKLNRYFDVYPTVESAAMELA